jgi:hypothetical protein
MNRRIAVALAALAAATLSPLQAQPPAHDLAEQKTRMAALSFLEGDWRGGGWVAGPDGKKMPFTQTEEIRFLLDGKILAIHGIAHDEGRPAESPPDFEAFAVVHWDDVANRYRFRSYARGGAGDYDAELVEDGVFVWRLSPTTEFRIAVEGDRWVETGHETRDGKRVQFFEMTLTRDKAAGR